MLKDKRTKQTRVKLKTGDEVVVISGKEKGKKGKVLFLNRVSNKVIVQGINMIKRYQKPTQDNPKPSILHTESSIHLSNVAYYDTKSKSPKRLSFILNNNKKIRGYKAKGSFIEIKEKVKEEK